MVSLMVMDDFSQMETFMKENGRKALQMDMVNIFTRMELFM